MISFNVRTLPSYNFVILSEAKDLLSPAPMKNQVLCFAQDDDDKVWYRRELGPLPSLCVRVTQIALSLVAFACLLPAQSPPQDPIGPPEKLPSAKKNSPVPKPTAPVPIFRDIAAQA